LFLPGGEQEEQASGRYLPYEKHPLLLAAIEHQEKATSLLMNCKFGSLEYKFHDKQAWSLIEQYQKRAAKREQWAKEKKAKKRKKK